MSQAQPRSILQEQYNEVYSKYPMLPQKKIIQLVNDRYDELKAIAQEYEDREFNGCHIPAPLFHEINQAASNLLREIAPPADKRDYDFYHSLMQVLKFFQNGHYMFILNAISKSTANMTGLRNENHASIVKYAREEMLRIRQEIEDLHKPIYLKYENTFRISQGVPEKKLITH